MPATVNEFTLNPTWTHIAFISWIKNAMSTTGMLFLSQFEDDSTDTHLIYEFTSPNFPSNYLDVYLDGNILGYTIYDDWDTESNTGNIAKAGNSVTISPANTINATAFNAGENARVLSVQEGTNSLEFINLGFFGIDYLDTNKHLYPKGIVWDEDVTFYSSNFSPSNDNRFININYGNTFFGKTNVFSGGIDIITSPPIIAAGEQCIVGYLNDDVCVGGFEDIPKNTKINHPSGTFQVVQGNKSPGLAIRIL